LNPKIRGYTARPLAAAKFEIRNPKHETNSNDRNPNDQDSLTILWGEKLDDVSINRSFAAQKVKGSCTPSNRRDGVNMDYDHATWNPLPNSIQRIQVRSAHRWIFENLLSGDRGNCHVHSVYDKTVNFSFEEHLVTLTSTYDGPATIVAGSPLPHLDPGYSLDPALLFDFTSAVAWAPPVFQIHPHRLSQSTLDELRESIERSGKSALLKKMFFSRFALALSALAEDFPQIGRGGTMMIGLGPGLTPSGDDFMSGFCHVLAHSQFKASWEQIIAGADSTTSISRTMLWWACQGVVASPFENLMMGISERKKNISKLLDGALAIGHSSGADHLLGIWYCLTLLHHMKKGAETTFGRKPKST
jgi:hypothetical protein